jgi:hypothetical protein
MSEIKPGAGNHLREAAVDVRYLADRGYPKASAIRFVSDHYRLPEEDRFVLARVVVTCKITEYRRKKALSLEEIKGRVLWVDGYNVIITTESLLKGLPVYQCDDGFLRDAQGIFKSYRACPVRTEFIFDQQISMSGSLSSEIREEMRARSMEGTARTARDVDKQLKDTKAVVATGDGNIIDAATAVLDLPLEIARREGIRTIRL